MILTTTESGSEKYCIKDKKDNRSYFDTGGRLTKIERTETIKNADNTQGLYCRICNCASDDCEKIY